LQHGVAGAAVGYTVKQLTKPDTFYIPVFGLSPQEIFSNQVPILDVNFFEPNEYEIQSSDGSEVKSSAAILQETVSKWYVALRNFALVGLLSVLVYIGIRIVFGSTAADKAKYKERLMDWIVAMFLLFMMHYIMYFAITLTESITEALSNELKNIEVNIGNLKDEGYKLEGDVEKILGAVTDGNGDVLWPTNFMGQARIKLQMINEESSGDTKLMQFGYTVIYLVFIIYTIIFLFQYLKRVVYMAFLTMIAPVVALTYPIDKMNDGRAQAFDMWLKEYIFNLLLQPFHLLLYIVLIGSAMEFATENTIYALVAIGFLIPAEKLLRRFFGFEKAQTASVADAAVGGAMAMKGMDMLKKIGNGGDKKNQKDNNRGKIRTQKNTNAEGTSGLINSSFQRTQTREAPAVTDGGTGNNGGEGDNGRVTGEEAAARLNAGNNNPQDPNGGNPAENGQAVTEEEAAAAAALAAGATVAGASDNETAGTEGDGGVEGDPGIRTVDDGGDGGDGSGDVDLDTPQDPDGGAAEPQLEANTNVRSVENDGDAPLGIRGGVRNLAATYLTKRNLALAGAHGLRFVARSGVRIAGGMAGATLGTVATVASGGKNAVSYIGGGALAGGVASDGISRRMANAAKNGTSEVATTFQEGRVGAGAYQDRLQEEADKATINRPEVRQMYIQEFGAQKGKEALQASLAYRKEGITDDKLIMDAMSLDREKFGDLNDKKRILVAKLSSTYKTEKNVTELKNRLTTAKNLSNTDAETIVNGIRKINKLV